MSSLPLSSWNHLCWKDTEMSFDITALLKIYNEIFSKYSRHVQSQYYKGIGFQGTSDTDHLSAIKQGTLTGTKIGETWQTIPQDKITSYITEQQQLLSAKHKVLCIGEFNKIVDYLESKGWKTFRARVMEVSPGNPDCWHLDGYDGSIRYHVPLITNDECYLQWKDENNKIKSFNLPADGSGYWINTDVIHQYINKGSTTRSHIVVDLLKK